jgi:DNA modification methylase
MEIKQGDLIILGQHRLMCDDSLNWAQVNKLIEGEPCQMMFTDPPYGIDYIPETKPMGGRKKQELGGIIGDKDTNLAKKFLKLLSTKIVKGSLYICAALQNYNDLWNWSLETFKRDPTVIVWVKNGYNISMRDYHRQYEFIFYNHFEEKKWVGQRNQSDVWYVPRRDTQKYIHPTQKPLLLVRRAIMNSSEESDTVLDLFGCSGTTLIACEQLKRRARMMELDPKYCSIIISRYVDFTKNPEIIINGKKIKWEIKQ